MRRKNWVKSEKEQIDLHDVSLTSIRRALGKRWPRISVNCRSPSVLPDDAQRIDVNDC